MLPPTQSLRQIQELGVMTLQIIVTGAIMLGFVLNIIFVDHPDTTSYTVAFVISLAVEGLLLGIWRKWGTRKVGKQKIMGGTDFENEPLRRDGTGSGERTSGDDGSVDEGQMV